jgi:hypothetical protein
MRLYHIQYVGYLDYTRYRSRSDEDWDGSSFEHGGLSKVVIVQNGSTLEYSDGRYPASKSTAAIDLGQFRAYILWAQAQATNQLLPLTSRIEKAIT